MAFYATVSRRLCYFRTILLEFHAILWNPVGILSNKLIKVVLFMVRSLKVMRFKVKETNKQPRRKRKTNLQLGTKNRNE